MKSPRCFIAIAILDHLRLRRWISSVLAIFVCPFLSTRSTIADAIVLHGQAEPVIGRILTQTEQSIRIETEGPSGSPSVVEIPVEKILLVLPAEDPKVLEKLEPGRWADYRDVADDLAARKQDPDAITTAMRLLLIVAYHGEGQQREGALSSLIGLARNPQEQRKLEAIAVRYGNRPAPAPDAPRILITTQGPSDAERNELLAAVRAIRRGKAEDARRRLAASNLNAAYEKLGAPLPWSRLESYARNRPTTPNALSELASLEAILLGALSTTPRNVPSQDREVWEQITRGSLPAWHDVDWFDVLSFDPRDCLFREGKWRRP